MTQQLGDYQVHLRDHDGNLLAVFDNPIRIEYEKRVNSVGYYTLVLNASDDRVDLFQLDYQVQIYRRDVGSGLDDWRVDFDGFHRTSIRELDSGGEETFISTGSDLNDLLARRVIAYKAGTIMADKNAPAETAMKEYVDENCGIRANVYGTTVGRLIPGTIEGFTVEDDQGRGEYWYGSRPFENLIDVLRDIAAFASMDFEVVRVGGNAWQFITYPGYKGVDRSYTNIDTSTGLNQAGNPPVVFSASVGTVLSAKYAFDRTAEANAVIVTGEGDGSTQETLVLTEEALIDDSPYNQREVSRSSQRVSIPGVNPDDLVSFSMQVSGAEALRDLAAREEFTFDPLRQPSLVYVRDFDIGDKVTVNFGAITREKRVIAVRVSVTADEPEKISLEFTDYPYVSLVTSSIIKQLAVMQAQMAKRLRYLESQQQHYEQQVQYLGIQSNLGVRLPTTRQILVHGSYTVDGDVDIEAGGELVVL